MKRTSLSLCLAATIAAALPTPAAAQAWTLSFAGGGQADIPLESGSLLLLQPDGRFTGRCVLSGGQCSGVSAPPPSGQLPTATLAGAATATTSAALQLSRTVTGAPELCVASAAPSAGVTGWNGAVGPASGTSSVSFTSNGTYALSMRCYNANGASSTAMHTVNVGGGGTTPPGCSLPPDPNIRPAGLTEYAMTWNQVFEREYPSAPGYLIPLGSFTPQRSMDGPLSAKMYLSISFVARAGVRGNIAFSGSQPIAAVGYTDYRIGNGFVTISPCAGDFRPPDPLSPDLFVRNCRIVVQAESSLFFGNSPTPSSAYCQLTPGQTYYLNVVMAPPGSLNGFTNSCLNGIPRCEINSQPRGQ